jgi:hypothetical protein
VGTTKTTIETIRDRSHWNMANIQPIDPVALGLCKQMELDAAVQKANAKKMRENGVNMTDEERRHLVSTEQSLGMDTNPDAPSPMAGLEQFGLGQDADEPDTSNADMLDAESFFNLPNDNDAGDDDDDT